MKANLRFPLRSLLDDQVDEADVHRVWRGIQSRGGRPRERVSKVVFSLAAALLTAVAVWALLRAPKARHLGPLALASGTAPSVVLVDEISSARSVELSDGSRVASSPGTRLEVLANDESLFLTALRQGRTRFDVHPGGPRRWIIECGDVTVEVVGTEFEIERTVDHVEVAVTRGVVLVRGELVPDRVQRLGAGEKLRVHTDTGADTPVVPTPGTTQSDSSHAMELPTVNHGASVGHAELNELIDRADAARRAGDEQRATRLLEEAMRRSGGDPLGAVAALTFARMTMANNPGRAARALSAALAIGVPHGIEEDARARLVEASARSGNHEAARRFAREYEARFPGGARSEEVRRWAGE